MIAFAILTSCSIIFKPLRKILIIIAALFLVSLSSSGQDNASYYQDKQQKKNPKRDWKGSDEEEKDTVLHRVELGINFGAYFPNKYSANFYNGTPGNVNNVNYIMSNTYWYRDIKLALGSIDTVLVNGYPTDMHYNVAFTGGLFLRLNLNRWNGLFLQANYTQLRAEDVVTLEVDPDPYSLKFPDLRLTPIVGREGRVLIDFGYQLSIPMKSKINIFLQAGATMCYTQVIRSIFVPAGTEYSLINIYGNNIYVPNTNMQTININQNAFGFGGYLGVGAGIPLTDMFGIEPGFFAHYYPANLQGYPDFKPSYGLYLRIMLYFGKTGDD